MKQMNNTCKEVLPSLLDKTKVQSIRAAWKDVPRLELEDGMKGGVDFSRDYLNKRGELRCFT